MVQNVYKKGDFSTLIPLAQNGDIKALEEILRKVQKQVYAVFYHLCDRKEDVSDLTQETLLKMAKSLQQLKNIKKFKPWLDQIIINIFNDFSRKNPNRVIALDETIIQDFKDKIGCEPGEKCILGEMDKLIKTALMTLPKDLRITLVLREFEGLSYDDISKITNTALGTVKSRISRARLKLQKELQDFI